MSDPFDLGSAEAPAARPDPPYLEALNQAQREAVEATEGPVLVLAGAGTGKTRVLTTRLAHLLATDLAWPGQILAVTFTNKAAREMGERLAALTGGAVEGLWLGTFHAMGARILRRHAELLGLKPDFAILDEDDQLRLLKQILRAADIDEKAWPARRLAVMVDGWKNRGLVPDRVPKREADAFAGGRAIDLYGLYQERLKALNAADFGDLLLHCLSIFTGHPEVLADFQRRFHYILVDEYQDSNVAQYLWLRLLAKGRRNICCVGDDDQSIYSWRGAEVGNILRFEEDFPGARVIRLERNYRSTPHILGAASGLIAHNGGRLGKTLWSGGEAGPPVILRGLWGSDAEAQATADEIGTLHAEGHDLNEIAILVRAGFQTREFEERFTKLGMPYRVIGGLRFYERQEIRDAIAYLRVLAHPEDDLALERIVNVPKRGLGPATLGAIHRLAQAQGTSLSRAARALVETDELRPKPRESLQGLLQSFDRWRGLEQNDEPRLIEAGSARPGGEELGAAAVDSDQNLALPRLLDTILEESGYRAMWEADPDAAAPGRLENLEELVVALGEFETVGDFLEHVSLVMDRAEVGGADMVNLMTLHGAKGLEFDSVFLPGWEEGLFPHPRALEEGGMAALEEERRLAYVGMTRARQRVYISFAASRRVHGEWASSGPSRFLEELPSEHIEVLTEPGLYGGPRADPAPASSRPDLGPRRSRDEGFVRGGGAIAGAGGHHAPPPQAHADLAVGDRLFHQKFGYGRILAIDGDKLEIAFEKAGRKKVKAGYVEPV